MTFLVTYEEADDNNREHVVFNNATTNACVFKSLDDVDLALRELKIYYPNQKYKIYSLKLWDIK